MDDYMTDKESAHTLAHAIDASDCSHEMRDIMHCVICERKLPLDRDHVDTCRGTCYQQLLRMQREEPSRCASS